MIFRRIALMLVVVALAGCNNEKNRNLLDQRMDQATRMSEIAQEPAPQKSYDPLVVSDRAWSGNKSMRLRHGLPLPAKFETGRGVTLISSTPLSIQDVVSAIATQTGIPVRADSDVGGDGFGMDMDQGGNKMPLAYEGSLSGLLGIVTSNYGINWRYDGVSLRLTRHETRVFLVETLPGTQTVKDGIKEDSAGDGGGSGSSAAAGGSYSVGATNTLQQSSEMSAEYKVWDELYQTLSSIIGGSGMVVLSPSTGTATVTTTPEKMEVVAKYIEEENRRLSQQIAVNVEIYTVAMQDNDDFNVTFDTALKKLSSSFGANIGGITGPAVSTQSFGNAGNLSVAILNPERAGQITSVFSALSSVGDTTRVSQFPMTTLNNRAVSRRIGRDRTYVAAISNVDSGTATFSSSTVTPGTIREGFSLQLTPRLLEDGRILMQYSLNLVDIVQMRDFDTGAGSVQLPETSSRVFVQQAMLRSGSTLIIGGYDDEQLSQSSSGVGSPYNYFFGGGSTNAKSRAMMFIAITPQVLDVPRAGRV